MLSDKTKWERNDDRFCLLGDKQSLFCVVFSSRKLTGRYLHHGIIAQELRFIIDSNFPTRWTHHPRKNFNNHEETTFDDIKGVLSNTIEKLKRANSTI